MVKKKHKKKQGKNTADILMQHKSIYITGVTIIAVLIITIVGFRYITENYKVKNVYVDGNIHYTNEQIMDIVMAGRYGDNSLILSLRYKDKSIEDIPFVEKMDVSILDKNSIRINVYEKAVAGYVEYLGRFLYFDKDGIVVESSQTATQGVPQVTGLTFEYAVLHEPLPVDNEAIFSKTLSLTQLLTKYSVEVDKIFFGEDDNITLYFGEVKVALGNDYHIDEKVMELQNILPKLEGKSGTLRMESYDEYTKETIFESDSKK